jgi:hypothetical protein
MSNKKNSPNNLTCFVFCFICSTLLSGCGSGVWSAHEQRAQPTNPALQTTPSVTVTPTSGRIVKPPSGANPSFASELPLLLSLPAATLPLNTETTAIATPLVGATTDTPLPPLPSSILLDSAANPPADFFLPAGIFGKPPQDLKQTAASPSGSATTPKPIAVTPKIQVTPVTMPEVILYASRTTRAYFSAGGVDAGVNIQAWEDVLRKYSIPFETVSSVESLEKKSSGVLVLPSTVALSERERQAVIGFRAKGGSVLASWLTGVRNEYGEWRGFGFMETALDTKVVGNTEADEDDTFLIPYGDSPVTHQVPAGLRIWMERAKEWYPLRLAGRHPAAHIMDWSRTVSSEKQSATLVFDERNQVSGKPSRSVVLGFPERLWVSADAKALEPIVLNAVRWLLRQPDAYTSAWPHPYASAFVLAIDAADTMADTDLKHGKLVGDLGGHATYYVLTEQAVQSAEILKKIQAAGHEIAYLGDRFEGFKELSTSAQIKRLDTMLREMKSSGIELAADAGFHPPMELYDKTTEKLLTARGFGYYVAGLDASEARLPFLSPGVVAEPEAKPAKTIVVLPRTQSDPEDLLAEGDPVSGLKLFLSELDLAEKMAGLSVVRISNKSTLNDIQLGAISKQLKIKRDRMWLTTAGQVAQWWRERERVSISFDSKTVPPRLSVTIKGDKPLQQAANVWVNLPDSGSSLRLVAAETYEKLPKIARIDAWRASMDLNGLTPGEYHWYLYFDRAPTRVVK